MDPSRWEDHHHGVGHLKAAGASAARPSHSHGFISFPPFPSAPCPSGSNCEVDDGGRTRIRERKRSLAAAADDRSSPVKTKKRASRSWKRVNFKRDNLADTVMELHKLVSPLGKKDVASILQEARHYIQIQHEQLKALTTAYLCSLPPSALQESEEMGTLTSRGVCRFPVCALPIDMLILLQSRHADPAAEPVASRLRCLFLIAWCTCQSYGSHLRSLCSVICFRVCLSA